MTIIHAIHWLMKLNTSIAILFGLVLIASCKNEEAQIVETVDIVGFWEGTITIDGSAEVEPQYANLLIKEDGTVTNEGQWFSEQRINVGTWELKNNNFKYFVTNVYGGENPNPQVGKADFDPTGKSLSGIWQNLSGSNSGTFEMVKRK